MHLLQLLLCKMGSFGQVKLFPTFVGSYFSKKVVVNQTYLYINRLVQGNFAKDKGWCLISSHTFNFLKLFFCLLLYQILVLLHREDHHQPLRLVLTWGKVFSAFWLITYAKTFFIASYKKLTKSEMFYTVLSKNHPLIPCRNVLV